MSPQRGQRQLANIDAIQQHIEVSGEERLQPRLNIQRAKVYFLQGHPQQAVELLNQSKAMALLTEDMESIHAINNQLLRHYLDIENFQAAQNMVAAVDRNDAKPLAYPYLLLKSKTHHGLGQTAQAIKWAELCKKQANEFWQAADEQYLLSLK